MFAVEVERFGIRLTLVEPGFFRTDLLDDWNARYPTIAVEDYAATVNVCEMWSV